MMGISWRWNGLYSQFAQKWGDLPQYYIYRDLMIMDPVSRG